MDDLSGVGKLLPNLKVTVGDENLTGEFSSLEDGEISDNTESQLPNAVLTKKDFAFNWTSTSKTAKPNKYGGFETGIDLSSENLLEKLDNRAARFGLKKEDQRQITSKEIKSLYKSLGMDPENLESSCKNIRLGVIHMRGVKEMSTDDVLGYFKDYAPSAVEWINDVSCNVCWYDDVSAARALLGVSQSIVIKRNSKNEKSQGSSENGSFSVEAGTAISEDSEIKVLTIPKSPEGETAMEMDIQSSDSASEADLKNKEFDISIPPGHWRHGVSHPKAGTLLLRFATKDDKKLPGAEKRSQYYQKYGNPNYGGLRGLISNSRKRKFQAMQTRQVVESLSSSSKDDFRPALDVSRIRRRSNIPVNSMRMYADIEELKIAQRSSQAHGGNRQSIKSRLGKRFSNKDLHEIGSQFSYEEDDPVEELSVECKIPSNFNIWNEQAMAMAREEEDSDDDDDDEEEEEEEEEEDNYSGRRSKRFCAHGSERASYESRKIYGYSEHSRDLLHKAPSSARRRNNAPRRDLRSRIDHLKHHAKSQKYISPLRRDDL